MHFFFFFFYLFFFFFFFNLFWCQTDVCYYCFGILNGLNCLNWKTFFISNLNIAFKVFAKKFSSPVYFDIEII